jgi:hypothetical protein
VQAVLAWRDFMVSNHSDAGQECWLADRGIDLLRGTGRLAGTGAGRSRRGPAQRGAHSRGDWLGSDRSSGSWTPRARGCLGTREATSMISSSMRPLDSLSATIGPEDRLVPASRSRCTTASSNPHRSVTAYSMSSTETMRRVNMACISLEYLERPRAPDTSAYRVMQFGLADERTDQRVELPSHQPVARTAPPQAIPAAICPRVAQAPAQRTAQGRTAPDKRPTSQLARGLL